jgi:predicted NUDIX family NTP pyrophosphohydrolase
MAAASGKMQTLAEIDRAEWFDLVAARAKISKASGRCSIALPSLSTSQERRHE